MKRKCYALIFYAETLASGFYPFKIFSCFPTFLIQ